MKRVNVLVFPCGSEVGLELNRALKDVSFITLFGASSVPDHGKYVYENYIEGLPFVDAADFIDSLNQIVRDKQIDYIYPAMDQVMEELSANQGKLEAVLVSPCRDAVYTCRNKARTYQRLEGLDFVPQTYTCAEEVDRFPVIIKPTEGYGAKGFRILRSRGELLYACAQAESDYVICEYLSGEEYTVDCFTDQRGNLQYASCRSRGRIRNGISVNSRVQPPDQRVVDIAAQISERIQMRGAWFFQLKRGGTGEYKLLEVATRVAGTMCVDRAAGVNLPLLTIFDLMGYEVSCRKQFETVEVDRALYNAFSVGAEFSEVYLDFDDTIVVHGKVNTQAVRFLYQCVNRGIPLTLITKHRGSILDDLKKYMIPSEIFADIIHIGESEHKCDFIYPKADALFVDDSFSERLEMQGRHGIVSLGVDCIDALIDYKN